MAQDQNDNNVNFVLFQPPSDNPKHAPNDTIPTNGNKLNQIDLERAKKILSFNQRKSKNKKKKNQYKNPRIPRKDRNNFGFNNELSDAEESQIFNALKKAIATHQKLSNCELLKIFQNALNKLNAAWFSQHLCTFFHEDNIGNNADVISLILRLFLLKYDLTNTRHAIPMRYLLLDMIASKQQRHRNHINTLQPTPQITAFHRSEACEIFILWICESTQNIKQHHIEHNTDYNNQESNDNDNDNEQKEDNKIDTNLLNTNHQKYEYHTLSFLTVQEMHRLFVVFDLNQHIPHKVRLKCCDKVYDILYNHQNAAKAIEFTLYFDLIHYIPYNILLKPLLKKQSLLHYALNYVDCLKNTKKFDTDFREKVKRFIVQTISELIECGQTNIAGSKATKLVTMWKYKVTDFKPLMLCNLKSFLRWTIYKGHIDDYAQMICAHEEKLKIFTIEQCAKHSSTYKSCVKWANFWNLAKDQRFEAMIQKCEKWILATEQIEKYNPHKNTKSNGLFIGGFDNLPICEIKMEQIIFVNDAKTFKMAQSVLLDDSVDCIGLDLELMSHDLQIPNAPKSCQILQISTFDVAFVFDLETIEKLTDFDDFLTQLFSESDAIKIGMAWDGDLTNLRKQFPEFLCFKTICTPYLELATISKFIRSDSEFIEKAKENKLKYCLTNEEMEKTIKRKFQKTKDKEGGLAKIVRWTLGKRLVKFEQLSNWSRRPLRMEQLKYAALDAMVECWLYRRFKEWENQLILPSLQGFCDQI